MGVRLVYLHGVGEGDAGGGWLRALNGGLELKGIEPIDRACVVAPHYADLLSTDGADATMPKLTYKVRNDDQSRREFERRQARVYRRLSMEPDVRVFGFHRVPEPVMDAAQRGGLRTGIPVLKQVRRYVESEAVRGAILRRILSHLPNEGDIVLVGHSLGSVIAIDLLDHLPPDLHVRRFVTLGSPANVPALHRGSDRLLKKFPYARVDDWSNFLGLGDPITGGRGLAWVFPAAQDFTIDVGPVGHVAERYLRHPVVSRLIAESVHPVADVAVDERSTELVLRITEEQEDQLLLLAFGHAVAVRMTDHDSADRYRSALQLIQDEVAMGIECSARAHGRALPPEVSDLAAGRPPVLPHRLEMRDAVRRLSALAETNVIAPYEIDTSKAQLAALPDIAVQLGFRPDVGKKVGKAITELRDDTDRGHVPWGHVLTGAAGLALIAAGPVGLVAAAPASAFGAAALTGGLAAFGPGGMVGGMALMGGLASAGAAVAATAVATGHSDPSAMDQVPRLTVTVGAQRALQLLDLQPDTDLWFKVTALETALSAEIARLGAFSDRKAPGLAQRKGALTLVEGLLRYMSSKGLGPEQLESGDDPGVE